ncbi:MAG: FAD-binding oxidoreductase [Chloroflexota bacterium]
MSELPGALLGTRYRPLATPDERARYAVDGREPRYVAEPATLAGLAEVLHEAAGEGLAVIPRGGGTKMGLGNVPRAADIVLSTRGVGGILDYTPADLTITVGAGMRLAELQDVLRRERQFLALDPARSADATLGGVVAANASGPRRLRYGSARDLVIGVRVAQTDGNVTKAGAKVVKNVAGYDLNKLYVGSLGSLVVLGEISFKLSPLPELYRTIVCPLPTLAAATSVVDRVLHSPLMPTALEIVTGATAQRLDNLAGWAGREAQGVLLLAEVDGFERGVARSLRDIEGYARAAGGEGARILDDDTAALAWDDVREAESRLGAALVLKLSVPVASVETLVTAAGSARLGTTPPAVISHAGSGIIYVYGDSSTPEVLAAVTDLRARAVRAGGSLVIERCLPAVKEGMDVWGDPGPALAVMQALKATFDPGATLNPGRFVGGL